MSSADWRSRLERLLAEHQREHATGAAKPDRIEAARAWHAKLVDNALAAPGWPKSVGGLELSLEDQLDYYRMTTAAGAPPHPCPLSFIVAPTLIQHGTPAAEGPVPRSRLLRADEFWCQGFSEPGAGSDLASLSTRAVRDGDVYRVTGQKVWTSMADRADWMFALVRTGPPGRSTEGITYLLIPMDSAGITVRPLRDISGAAHFAEVFLDDVEVAVDNRVGAEGQGWSIMRTSLGHERATAFLADEFKYRRTADKVIELVVSQQLDYRPAGAPGRRAARVGRAHHRCQQRPGAGRRAARRGSRRCGVGEPAGEVGVRAAHARIGAAGRRVARGPGQPGTRRNRQGPLDIWVPDEPRHHHRRGHRRDSAQHDRRVGAGSAVPPRRGPTDRCSRSRCAACGRRGGRA